MNKFFKMFLIVCVLLSSAVAIFAQDEMGDDMDLGVDEEIAVDAGDDSDDDSDMLLEDNSEPAMEEVPEIDMPADYQKGDSVELSGMISVTLPDTEKGEKYSTIILQVGEDSYKLLPSENKDAFKGLEDASGKSITVKGTYLPADEAHPLAAVKVSEWSE